MLSWNVLFCLVLVFTGGVRTQASDVPRAAVVVTPLPTSGSTSIRVSTRPMKAQLKDAMVDGVACGVPRLGSDDPMDLTVANFGGRSLGIRAANFSVAPTIVGGSDALFGSICWQVRKRVVHL